eukprot:4335628-Amphidinium_carterae.1
MESRHRSTMWLLLCEEPLTPEAHCKCMFKWEALSCQLSRYTSYGFSNCRLCAKANLVAKKKEAVLKDKKQVDEERDLLSKELSQKEREYEQMKGHKFMKRDEFKNYAATLRDKSAKFKRLKGSLPQLPSRACILHSCWSTCKGELSEIRHEVAILTKTELILQAKDSNTAEQHLTT